MMNLNVKAYFAVILALFATSCFAISPTRVADTSLVGEWVSEINTLCFGADGSMAQIEDDTTYRLNYRFDGELLYTILREGGIEYLDYFFVLVDRSDPTIVGIIHYEYVYLKGSGTGEVWDPELMSFDEESSKRHFANYLAAFNRSGEPMERWFDLYTRRR